MRRTFHCETTWKLRSLSRRIRRILFGTRLKADSDATRHEALDLANVSCEMLIVWNCIAYPVQITIQALDYVQYVSIHGLWPPGSFTIVIILRFPVLIADHRFSDSCGDTIHCGNWYISVPSLALIGVYTIGPARCEARSSVLCKQASES